MGKFREFIAYLIYDKEYKWLETIINKLCEWEMYIRGTAVRKVFGNFGKIPEGIYCYEGFNNVCPYWNFSRIATFFYGKQSAGYCYYLNEGDFNSDTMILWDMCKCCGVNDEEDIDEEDIIECNLEL